MLRERVLLLLSEKFLAVALDGSGMTPDLMRPGCAVFCNDTHSLFHPTDLANPLTQLPPLSLRLLDVSRLMRLPSRELVTIGDALCGLAGQPPPLALEGFVADERLFEEAVSMVRAKGLMWAELGDLLAVLNRRRDLAEPLPPAPPPGSISAE